MNWNVSSPKTRLKKSRGVALLGKVTRGLGTSWNGPGLNGIPSSDWTGAGGGNSSSSLDLLGTGGNIS